MSLKQAIFGERSLTKVAAVFPTRDTAENAARYLHGLAGMSDTQVKLVGPVDGYREEALSRKLEPEQNGIWHTLLRAHAISGAIGAMLGGLVFLGLVLAEEAAVLSSPVMSLVSMLFFGTLFGLLVGGVITLRPDHSRVIAAVRNAVKHGYWAVVTHPVNSKQVAVVVDELGRRSLHVVRTL